MIFSLFLKFQMSVSWLLQPPFGTPIQGRDVVICKFPGDPTILLGSLSTVALIFTVILGHIGIFFPYKGKPLSTSVLFGNKTMLIFFYVAE